MADESFGFDFEVDLSEMEALIRDMPSRVASFLDAEAEELVTDIKLSFGTSPPGRVYRRKSKTHIASQPGYPPNVDMNRLRGSIKWTPEDRFTRDVHDGVEYGIYLELGTTRNPGELGGEKLLGPRSQGIAPRPFLGPAFERARRAFAERLKDWLEREA